MEHPSVRRGRQKEFHFFDWRWNDIQQHSEEVANETGELADSVKRSLAIRNQVRDKLLLFVYVFVVC